MMGKTSVELLIFDLDGTLIESKWDIAASVNLTLAELGLPQRPIEEIFGFVGDGVKQLLRLSVGEGSRVTFDEALRVFRGQYLAHCLDRTTFYPGVGEMLTHFAGKRKAVATNKSIEYTNVILQGLGANHFQCVVGGDQRVRIEAGAGHAVACNGTTECAERADRTRRGQHQRHQRRPQCGYPCLRSRLWYGESGEDGRLPAGLVY